MKYFSFIRKRGYVTVDATPEFRSSPAWGDTFFARAVDTFNGLSSRYQLKTKFKIETGLDKLGLMPDVLMDAHDGSGDYVDSRGKTQTIQLPSKASTYRGTTVGVNGGGSATEPGFFRLRSYIFMPTLPQIDGDTVGAGVRMSVLLHEMVHAIGLEGDDPNHGDNEKGIMPGPPHDLFCTGGFFNHVTGDQTHEKDYITFGDHRTPGKNGEFTLSDRTVRLINDTWSL